jgi:hypothetical protein
MLKDFACTATRRIRGTVGWRWFLAVLGSAVLAGGSGVTRALAYHAPDSQDKVYSIRLNEQDPELGRKRHNIGLLDLMITNLGIIGNPGFIPQESAASWRGGEYLYAASLWIGAVASDNLAYVSTGLYETELRPSLAVVDHIYSSYEGAVKGNRQGFSTQPDDDNDGATDEDVLNGKDDDGDGKVDEDFAAISQQMYSCEYWDYTEEARNRYPEHRPLNLRIHQESYAWSTEGANEFVGFDFKIFNDGFETLRKVYLGFFVDSDVGERGVDGYYTDDGGAFYATDTTFSDPSIDFKCTDNAGDLKVCGDQKLSLNICYMYDVPDNGETAKGGDVPGFAGGMFLGHTVDPFGVRAPPKVTVHTARFFNGSNPYPQGDPSNDTERYDLLQSGQKPTRPTGVPDDYRYCFAAGPFSEMAPGEVLQLQMAFVVGMGKAGMLTNAVNAQLIYNGKWRDVDGDRLGRTGYGGRETCLRAFEVGEPVTWKDPCDSLNPTSRTIKETYCLPDNYVNNDCDCCTPLFQTQSEADNMSAPGLETLVHWVGTVAPPAPATNVDRPDSAFVPAGDRSVLVAWDNQSELTADPIQRRILFTGYKVWRVEGWNRPVGSAGPAPEDWQLKANLSLDPEDRLGADSPFYLLKYRNDIDSLYSVPTGSAIPGEQNKWYYPVGRYSWRDTSGVKNGMVYFYDVTGYASYTDPSTGGVVTLEGRPSATERDAIFPRWSPAASGGLGGVYVVPNPYIKGKNPAGWDLTPSKVDPTGTKLAFVGLPADACTVKIFTLAGDLVRTLDNQSAGAGRVDGAVFWDLISRNGQDIVAGVYIYLVECGGKSKVGRFVVVR